MGFIESEGKKCGRGGKLGNGSESLEIHGGK